MEPSGPITPSFDNTDTSVGGGGSDAVPDRTGPTEVAAGVSAADRPRPRVAWLPLVLIAAILLVGASVALVVVKLRSGESQLSYTIPAGTGQRIDAGEQVEIIPQRLNLHTGDSITVVNDDDRLHTVGPFAVRAHETLTYRFDYAGVYKGICTVHPSGEVNITVT